MRETSDPQNMDIVLLIVSAFASVAIGVIAFFLVLRFPSLGEMTCGASSGSGCIEWSLVLFGPLYLAFYILALTLATLVSLAPFAAGLASFLRKKKTAGTGKADT